MVGELGVLRSQSRILERGDFAGDDCRWVGNVGSPTASTGNWAPNGDRGRRYLSTEGGMWVNFLDWGSMGR